MHEPNNFELNQMNYRIKARNVEIINIGHHDKLYYRLLKGNKYFKKVKSSLDLIDIMLVRAPTPLIFNLCNKFKKPIVLYLVGSYKEGSKVLSLNFFKNYLIRFYAHLYETKQKKLIMKYPTIVNSRRLFFQYKPINDNIVEIKSTTLSRSDFFERNDTCQNINKIKILYTGRVEESKGVFEILNACIKLNEKGFQIEFHVAGMVMKGLESVPLKLKKYAKDNGMEDKFKFHGMLKIGDDLNDLYRKSDIYVIASKSDFEGFPRTIWEAMANSLPVIASDVGSIPFFLKDKINAIIFKRNDGNALFSAMKELIKNKKLRKTIIEKGYSLAKENTLETQSILMVKELKKHLD